jgi:hypothetical protein
VVAAQSTSDVDDLKYSFDSYYECYWLSAFAAAYAAACDDAAAVDTSYGIDLKEIAAVVVVAVHIVVDEVGVIVVLVKEKVGAAYDDQQFHDDDLNVAVVAAVVVVVKVVIAAVVACNTRSKNSSPFDVELKTIDYHLLIMR